MKDKFTNEFLANTDDARAGKLSDIQQQLDELQNNGMTAMDIRTVLFNKMLDVWQLLILRNQFIEEVLLIELIHQRKAALQSGELSILL
mgnify:CR=1 FL=1